MILTGILTVLALPLCFGPGQSLLPLPSQPDAYPQTPIDRGAIGGIRG